MAGQAKEMRDEWELKLFSALEELNVATEADLVKRRVITGKNNKVKILEKLTHSIARKPFLN